jgi:hypothetical protein
LRLRLAGRQEAELDAGEAAAGHEIVKLSALALAHLHSGFAQQVLSRAFSHWQGTCALLEAIADTEARTAALTISQLEVEVEAARDSASDEAARLAARIASDAHAAQLAAVSRVLASASGSRALAALRAWSGFAQVATVSARTEELEGALAAADTELSSGTERSTQTARALAAARMEQVWLHSHCLRPRL